MSGAFPILVTAHSEKFIHVWDLKNCFNNNFNPIEVRESPLKFATSAICAYADGKGYTVGSIEGRCGIVNIDLQNPSSESKDDFCFKCHRQENPKQFDGDVYTVNSISFNKLHNTFGTCGSDGQYIIWNKDTKSKYKSSTKAQNPMPVTAGCFSDDASVWAFATGEDWSLGAESAKLRAN